MENMRTKREADIASDQGETEAKEAMDNWGNSVAKVQYSLPSTYWFTQRIQDDSQQQVPSLMRSTHRTSNYYGGQLERDQKSTNFKVS